MIIDKINNYIVGRAELKKALFSSSWLFAENLIRLVTSLVVSVLVARYLGPQLLGMWSYALSLVSIITIFTTLGMDTLIVRELVNNNQKSNILMGSALAIRIISSIVFIALIILYATLFEESAITRILIAVSSISLLFQSFDIIRYYFESEVLSKYVAISKIISLLVISLVKLLLIYLKASVVYFAIATSLEFFLISLLLLFIYNRKYRNLSLLRVDRKTTKSILQNTWPLLLSGILISLGSRIDQIMLANIIGKSEVGIYSIAISLTEAWYFIPTVVVVSTFPAIVKLRKMDKYKYMYRLQNMYDFFTWISIFIAIFISIFSSTIIYTLYGSEYIRASSILSIYIWNLVFTSLILIRSRWIVSENLQKYSVIYLLVAVVINISLNLILIPKYLGNGAALSTLISSLFSAIITPYFIKRTRLSTYMIFKSFALPLRLLRKI